MEAEVTCDIHIGDKIKEVLVSKGISVSELALSIPCTRENANKILRKKTIDTALLIKISRILEYDFFNYISESLIFKGKK